MKRQVAIVGRTPEFIRWSIRRSCPLRENSEVSSPEATERCLRSLREASLAIEQDRVVDGLAFKKMPADPLDLHDAAGEPRPSVRESSDLRCFAFFIDEAFASFGGRDQVTKTCQDCLANVWRQWNLDPTVERGSPRIVGCHGMFSKPQWGIPSRIDEIISNVAWSSADFEPIVSEAGLSWYGLWTPGLWKSVSLPILATFFEQVAEQIDQRVDFDEFVLAVQHCDRNALPIDLSLNPGGYSNGVSWMVDSHCPDCKAAQDVSSRKCLECGRNGSANPARKRKVLGRRPFVEIESLVHPSKIENLRNKIEQRTDHR